MLVLYADATFCSLWLSYLYMKILFPAILLFFSLNTYSQALDVFTGFGHGVNNEAKSFNFIPIKVRWLPVKGEDLLSFSAVYDVGLNAKGEGHAYTLHPDLPSAVVLKETIKTNVFAMSVDLNFNVYTTPVGNQASLYFSPIGYAWQGFKVDYPDFDKENYEILDQDVNRKFSGFFFKIGADYRFNFNKIIAFEVNSPLLKGRPKNFNYLYAAPMHVMVGYRFMNKKNNTN